MLCFCPRLQCRNWRKEGVKEVSRAHLFLYICTRCFVALPRCHLISPDHHAETKDQAVIRTDLDGHFGINRHCCCRWCLLGWFAWGGSFFCLYVVRLLHSWLCNCSLKKKKELGWHVASSSATDRERGGRMGQKSKNQKMEEWDVSVMLPVGVRWV